MSQKRPLLLSGFISFLLLFGVFAVFDYNRLDEKEYQLWLERRRSHLVNYYKLSRTLLELETLPDLEARLEEAVTASYIDFYILREGENIVYMKGKMGLENLKDYSPPIDTVVETDSNLLMIATDVNGMRLLLGSGTSKSWLRTLSLSALWQTYVVDLFLFVLIGVIVFFWFFRDIASILYVFRNKNRRAFGRIKTRSLESDLFVQGLTSYEKAVDELKRQNATLGNQVLPALKSEILSGRMPPYDFHCTLVRTDINGFSKIFNTYPVEPFMETINGFFKEVSHIVSRYEGLIHEFVGDEVIYYFKDEKHPNSVAIALSAIRDIHECATRLSERTVSTHGYAFTVKSSLSHGKIRFGELVNGYSLAGALLIETVRILSVITERDENAAYFMESCLVRSQEICETRSEGVHSLKGYSASQTLHSYRRHRDLESILSEISVDNARLLTYYRGDAHLVRILEFLRNDSETMAMDTFLAVVRVLRQAKVTQSSADLKEALLGLMERLRPTTPDVLEEDRCVRLLSSVSMLAINLVGPDQYDSIFEERLTSFLTVPDQRVVANIVEVMIHQNPEKGQRRLKSLLQHENNRILANTLVLEGRRELSSDVVRRLQQMLRSNKALYMASALYAIGELGAHYRSTDMIYVNTHVPFLKLIASISKYIENENEMVRRQALIAARKIDDEKLNQAIHEIGEKTLSVLVEQEIAIHFHRRSDKRAA